MNPDLRIAVIDDDALAIETVVSFLKAMGFRWIFQFPAAKMALEFMTENPVDFIISDWEMPEMDGLALLKSVRNNSELEKLPFIMIASQISNEKIKIEDAHAAGVDAYLVKPFRMFLLMEKIADVLFERHWATRSGALIVDDDATVREFMNSAMQHLGFSPVHSASDGAEGLKMLETYPSEISIVVCDWDMPKFTGIELLRKVRSTSTLSKMPFIMATAQIPGEKQKLTMAIESDVDHYLLKPFRVNDLKEKVDMVLAKAKAKALPKHILANARSALIHNDYASAEKLFLNVLEKDSQSAEAYLGLAEADLAQDVTKNFDSAIKNLQMAIHIAPAWDRPHIEIAKAYEVNMALEKAIDCMKAAIKICHASADLHFHLGRLLSKRGRLEAGAEELQRAIELNPAHQEALTLLATRSKKGAAT